ncbi:MAG: hypothetical protein RLZZ15_84, partial [Verrucomicrobiota bacterium]
GLATGALFAAVGLLVGVVMFFNRLGTRPLNQGHSYQEIEEIVGEALPNYIDGEKLREMRACRFDQAAAKLDLSKILGPQTAFFGLRDGEPVIVFYDPNCGHCKNYHPTFQALAERYKDRARFVIRPRMLWEQSRMQVEALAVAETSGKYFQLWQRMFDLQPGPRKSLTLEQITGLFNELGIDSTNLEKRLAAVRPAVNAMQENIRQAGINGVPAMFIGERRIWVVNRSEACVGKLLEWTLARKAASAATPKLAEKPAGKP